MTDEIRIDGYRIVALGYMRESRERIDKAQDALDAMIHKAFARQRKRLSRRPR